MLDSFTLLYKIFSDQKKKIMSSLEYGEWVGDSSQSNTLDLDNPVFYLNSPFLKTIAFKVLQASIPFSYYTINTANNTFLLKVGASTSTVTLTPGNYNIVNFIPMLQAALNAASTSLDSAAYTVTFDTTTSKLTITSSISNNFSFVFDVSGTDPYGIHNPRTILGFPTGTTTASGTVLTAPYVINLTGPNYLYLCSSYLGGYNGDSLTLGNEGSSGSVIAKIEVNTNPGGTITYQDPDTLHYFSFNSSVTIERIDLFLAIGAQNSMLLPISLNGRPFDVKLGFVTESDSSSTSFSGTTNKTIRAGPL